MTPLIELRGVTRIYLSGDESLTVLKDIDLTIERGEMVAIVGPSGSGKSTLMNILGLLDRPTTGSYAIDGEVVSFLDNDARSRLRREHLGFIFQRYQILGDLSALANVEMPAIYAGHSPAARRDRAASLLQRLGMGARLSHRPGQLSGGQQQRVSIARALINGGDIILADEPTGALDRDSGEEVLRILAELHDEGRTVVIVTHDMSVASHADRIIEIADGRIVADRRTRDHEAQKAPAKKLANAAGLRVVVDQFLEATTMALRSLAAHQLRTFLTMLGIIIGIASVICVVALGEGSQRRVLENISSLGTNTLEVFPGSGFGDTRSGRVKTSGGRCPSAFPIVLRRCRYPYRIDLRHGPVCGDRGQCTDQWRGRTVFLGQGLEADFRPFLR